MAGLPPKHATVPSPAEQRIGEALKAQQSALTARLRTGLKPGETPGERSQVLSAMAMGVRSTADLAKHAKEEVSKTIKEKGIAHSTARRATVGRLTGSRRTRRGAGLWDVVEDVCEGAGCPTRARQLQRKREADESKARLAHWVATGRFPGEAPPPTQGQLRVLARQRGEFPPRPPKKIGGRNMAKTRRNTTSGGDIVSHLLTIRNQVKLYHWQTGSFARHKATDDLTAALDLNIDAFVESYMGRYGRPKVSGSIKLHNFSETAAKAFVARETQYLQTVLPRKISKTDTDLLNLRDTILGDLTKVLYLFTLQ